MNDRELATLIWLAVFALFAVSQRDVRRQLPGLVVLAVNPTISVPFLAMVAYVGGLVLLGCRSGIWEASLTSDTVTWFVAIGVGLFGLAASEGVRPLTSLLRVAAGLTVFTEVFINLYVFDLWVELILVAVVTVVVAMLAFAEAQDEFRPVEKLLKVVMGGFGLALIVYVGVRLATQWHEFDKVDGLRRLALPVWLTLGLAPFLAVLGLWSNYSRAFAYLRWATEDRRRRRRARLALVSGLHINAREVRAFDGRWSKELVAASSWSEARDVLERFRRRQSFCAGR
ncbi:MAG: hypothetical protein M3P40_00380 [Actinomycetota bacterium]|nr:hypothetical protein [Actinomycetota bacterium]